MSGYKTEQEALENAPKDHDFHIEYFGGKNCEDFGMPCSGWDTQDRRCDCGNRRVSWETSQNSNGLWYAYAEAY